MYSQGNEKHGVLYPQKRVLSWILTCTIDKYIDMKYTFELTFYM